MTEPEETPSFLDSRWLAWRLVAELKDQGVTGDYSFLGFHCDPVVWLTQTDLERDKLLTSGLVRGLLAR